MQKHVDLKTATTNELKAAAYDLLVQGQDIQRKIAAIEQEIARRPQTGCEPETDQTKKESEQ